MKRPLLLLSLLLLLAGALLGLKQLPNFLTPWVAQKVASALPGSHVSIGKVSGTYFNSVRLSDIVFEDEHSKLTFGSAEIRYTLIGLFKKNIDLLLLQNGEVIYHNAKEPMPRIRYGAGNASGAFSLKKLSLQNLALDIQTKDLSLMGKISFSRDMEHNRFFDGELSIPSLTAGEIRVKDLHTTVDHSQRGTLTVEQVRFQKWSLGQARLSYKIDPDKVLLTLDSVDWLSTTLKGSGEVSYTQPLAYSFRLDISTLPVTEILTAYEWDKKLSVTGQLGGHLELSGEGSRLTALNGRLQNLSDGTIVILDQAFLQRIADSAKQPIEIIKASFENYHYNTGDIAVTLDKQDIRLGIELNGEAGKRNLEVHLHDLF